MASAASITDSRIPLHQHEAVFDCEDGSMRKGQSGLMTRKTVAMVGSVVVTFAVAVAFGFFIMGPLVANHVGTKPEMSDTGNAMAKAYLPNLPATQKMNRRSAMQWAGATAATVAAGAFGPLPALADDEVVAAPAPPPPAPKKAVATLLAPEEYKLKKDYPQDAKKLLSNMRAATDMQRGNPDMEKIVTSTRSQMNDFVAFYRRQPKVAGMPSFSTLYTAVNTLAGHYASYGNKYPVPAKRATRLNQQYKEIERALARGK